ncbi:MAG: four-helix bundle copper-binding protein [Actinomycetota bacterium]|nr:four-helix bundle copper-binding protein [Actinomycetota bacterium]
MTYALPMLQTYPSEMNLDTTQLAAVIDAVAACSQACTACADACLSESAQMLPHLVKCIRDNLDCADVCAATARVLSRHTGYDANLTQMQVQAALQAVQTCGASCGEHAEMHEHCRVCAQACRHAEQALVGLLGQLQPSGNASSSPGETATPPAPA